MFHVKMIMWWCSNCRIHLLLIATLRKTIKPVSLKLTEILSLSNKPLHNTWSLVIVKVTFPSFITLLKMPQFIKTIQLDTCAKYVFQARMLAVCKGMQLARFQ